MDFLTFIKSHWVSITRPLSSRLQDSLFTDLLTDVVTVAYALWTVACHVTVVLKGNVRRGLTTAAIVAVACFLCLAVLLWKRPETRKAYFDDLRESPFYAAIPLSARARLVFIAAVPIVLITWLVTRNPWLVWMQMVIAHTLFAIYGLQIPVLAVPESDVGERARRLSTVALFIAAFICMAFTLFSFRPRPDESFYASMGASIVNYPNLAVSKLNTLHGFATKYLPEQRLFPPYRVHSFELLGGYLSYLSGVEPTKIVHLLIAPLFGWFAPFAIARLLKLLTPRYWAPALFVTLSYYFIEGSAGRGFANQSFIRFF